MTAWLPDVVPDEIIESAWGNTIRDRTITPFANAGDRAAAIPTPKAGMEVFLVDKRAFEFFDGTAWRRGPAVPHTSAVGVIPGSANTNTGAPYTDLNPVTRIPAFVKYRDDTLLIVEVKSSGWLAGSGAGELFFGVQVGPTVGGTDYDLGGAFYQAAESTGSYHKNHHFARTLPAGIAAGTYQVTVRRKNVTAARDYQNDGKDEHHLIVREENP